MESKTKTVEAIIISRRDWGEADRLLTAFSKDGGKIRIVARGARRLKSKMACHIEPFCWGKYTLHAGKKYQILTGAESRALFPDLTSNVSLYESANYVCELVDAVALEGQTNSPLYNLFKKTLLRLAEKGSNQEIILREFEFHLLENIGYETQYLECKKCHALLTEQEEFWGNFEGFLCPNCGKEGTKISKNTLKVLRILKQKNEITELNGITTYNEPLKTIVLSYLYDILPKIPKSKSYEFRK